MVNNDLWPPAPFDIAYAKFREHDGWVRQDADLLNAIYSGKDTAASATHTISGRPYRGGALGQLSKMFLGRPIVQDEKRMFSMPPLAGDICMLSAALLFGEAPTFRYPKPETVDQPKDATDTSQDPAVDAAKKPKWRHPAQDTLDLIMGSDQAHAQLLKLGEYSAALGGAYLAVVWDESIRKNVFPRAYRSDCAVPMFRYGELVSVTLWSEYRTENASEVYRLLERHDRGQITYTLRKGTEKTIGPVVALDSIGETAHYNNLRTEAELEAALQDPSIMSGPVTVSTGVDALAVVYIPNSASNPNWDKLGSLANLGRSDLDGIEDMLDKYTQILTSMMRDFEIGQGRITVPEEWLDSNGRGQGGSVDLNREVYVGVKSLQKGDTSLKDQAIETQFDIRVDVHDAGMDVIKRAIAERTGYSPAHLGVKDAATGTKTATEITADFTDSERTRDTKAMLAKPHLARFAQVAIAIQKQVFGTEGAGWYDELPDVEFTPISQQDMEKAARIVQTGFMSESMSRRERVRQLNPNWDDEQIDDEVAELKAEFGDPAPDPATFTADPTTPDGTRPPVQPAVPSKGAMA